MRAVLCAITAALGLLAAGAASAAECLPQVSVRMMVRIGDGPAVDAVLEGGIETPLSLFDVASRRLLWSAGAHASVVQAFPAMTAAFTGSLTAIDLDADGLPDRIYAGDMAARIWRIDLHHGAPAAHWASGGVFADFSNSEGRGFLAAADVSLSSLPGGASWLNIAVGTAAPGNPEANNRFYALRDQAVYESWTDEDYARWPPLREEDLTRVVATVQAAADAAALPDPASPGWYVELGRGHVVAPSLTVNNRAVLVIAPVMPRGAGPCEVFARIATLDLTLQQIVTTEQGEWQAPVSTPVPVAASFSLGAARDGIAPCTLAGQRIAACDVDTRPRKTWWRREDAE